MGMLFTVRVNMSGLLVVSFWNSVTFSLHISPPQGAKPRAQAYFGVQSTTPAVGGVPSAFVDGFCTTPTRSRVGHLYSVITSILRARGRV